MEERWLSRGGADERLRIICFLDPTSLRIYVHRSRSGHVSFDCILNLRHLGQYTQT